MRIKPAFINRRQIDNFDAAVGDLGRRVDCFETSLPKLPVHQAKKVLGELQVSAALLCSEGQILLDYYKSQLPNQSRSCNEA